MTALPDEQAGIKNWFNQTYQREGFGYLRPLAAYAIYAKLLALQPGEPFLDVACGPGLMLRQALDAGCVVHGIDISDQAIAMARNYVPAADTRQANAQALPFADGAMAAITCLGSLERMLDLEAVLREIHRVCQPNGRCCFLVRNSETFSWKFLMEKLGLRNKAGHQGANSLAAWTAIFEGNGFVVDQVLPDQWPFVRWGQFLSLGLHTPDPLRLRHGLKPLRGAYEFIFLLHKRPA